MDGVIVLEAAVVVGSGWLLLACVALLRLSSVSFEPSSSATVFKIIIEIISLAVQLLALELDSTAAWLVAGAGVVVLVVVVVVVVEVEVVLVLAVVVVGWLTILLVCGGLLVDVVIMTTVVGLVVAFS